MEFSQTNAIIVEKTFSWCRTCFVISVSVTRLNWRGPWVPGQRRLDAQDESMWKSSCRIFLGRKSVSNYCHPPLLIILDHLSSVLYIGDSFKVAKDVETSFWHGWQGQGRQKYQLWMYFSEWVLSPIVNHNGRLLPLKTQGICGARPRCVWNNPQHAYCLSASVRTDLGQVVY